MADEEQALLPAGSHSKKRSVLLHVCPYILGNEFCERLAFFGLASNLVIYINTVMGESQATAAIQVNMFQGLCYTMPLVGAYVADSHWGRYKTILFFSLIYVAGLALLTASASVPGLSPPPGQGATGLQFLVLSLSLATIALGTGGIKPNVSAFGADQFNLLDPQEALEKEMFFGFFYMAVNIGSFIALTLIVWIQVNIAWSVGFAVPGVVMAVGILLFVSGSARYRHVAPTQSPMTRVVQVVAAALRHRWQKRASGIGLAPSPRQHSQEPAQGPAERTVPEASPLPYGDTAEGEQVIPVSNSVTSWGGSAGGGSKPAPHGACTMSPWTVTLPGTTKSYRWLDDAISWQGKDGVAGFTPHQVEEVKMVLRLLPVFVTTILYWAIQTQINTFFVQQGSLMRQDVDILGHWLKVPAASMGVFNTIAIISLVPVFSATTAWVRRCWGFKVTMLQRIGSGMVVAAMAMLLACGVEVWRLARLPAPDQRSHGATPWRSTPLTADLCIFWQAPQYFLVGLSEVLTAIGALEFFYDQAPSVMRSCSMALLMLATAIGNFSAGFLVAAVQGVTEWAGHQWIPPDLNVGRLDLYFLLMATLMTLNFAAYLVVAVRYEIAPHTLTMFPACAGGLQSSPHQAAAVSIVPGQHSSPLPLVRPAGGMTVEEEEAAQYELLYGRSLAYVPPSPALPPNFR